MRVNWKFSMEADMRARVRFANFEDFAWCTEIDKSVAAKIIDRKIEQKEIIVAEIEGEKVGYMRFEYLWAEIPFLSLIHVQERYRRKGIGRSILAFLERFLLDRGHNIILSSSQANEREAQAWHRAMGFEECGYLMHINKGGVGEIFFRKSLTP